MSEEVKQDSPEQTNKSDIDETLSEGSSTEAPVQPVSEEELIKGIKDEDTARTVAEILRSHRVASVYIDARSGGVFFSGKSHITGDVVGQDQVKQTTTSEGNVLSEVAFGRVLSKDKSKVRNVYVETTFYRQAKDILSEKHLLILSGQAHWGKWTTAIHLLLTFQTEEILEINPDVNLDKLRSFDLKPKQGYVIDTLAPDSVKNLNSFTLNRISSQLQEKNSYLVLTIDSRTHPSKETLSSYLIFWQEVPDHTKLLKRHLNWYLSNQELLAKAWNLSQTEAVQDLLTTRLLPGEIDRLAELLARVTHDDFKLEDALARFETRARHQVETWFLGHTDLEERTFMLSLAVFNGANYQVVIEADERLQALIKPPSKNDEPVIDSLFTSTRSQRVKEACAHLVPGYEETHFGRSPVDLIELDNPTFQPTVLHYVWHEYDRLHKPLLEWLRGLGFHPHFDVRARAAAAVGELSKYNFGHIHTEVLLPWANHENSRARAAAALALGIPAWEGEFAPQVLGLLHHWSTLRNNWRLGWTAAYAYGGLVGLRFPDLALYGLYTVAQTRDLRLFEVVSHSVASIFQAGQQVTDYYLKVLVALLAWTANPKAKMTNLIGLLIFLQLTKGARVEAEPEGGSWPTLLWLAREDKTYRDIEILLFRRALNTKSTRKNALDTLHQWLLAVDEDTRLYLAVEQIIVTLAMQGTEREKDRLHFYLDRWASHPKKDSQSAANILASLNST